MDIGQLRKSIFAKGSFFGILQVFGSLGGFLQHSLAAESLFLPVLSIFAQISILFAELVESR
jgi:hypothetical protein